MREGGILIHPVAMVTILGEFLEDSQTSLFPMFYFFQTEEEKSDLIWEREVCRQPHNQKKMYAAILKSFTHFPPDFTVAGC